MGVRWHRVAWQAEPEQRRKIADEDVAAWHTFWWRAGCWRACQRRMTCVQCRRPEAPIETQHRRQYANQHEAASSVIQTTRNGTVETALLETSEERVGHIDVEVIVHPWRG